MGKYMIDLRDSNQTNYFDFLTLNSKGCVVDFYADWCGPCRILGTQLENAISNDENIMKNLFMLDGGSLDSLKIDDVKNKVVLVKINIDNFENLANQFKVSTIPHVVYYKDGNLQSKVPGSCKEILKVLNSLV